MIVTAGAVLAACAPLLDPEYYLLPRLPRLYLYDDFTWSTRDSEVSDMEDTWVDGATDGQTAQFAVQGGSFIVVGLRTFLLSEIELYGATEISVEYTIFRGLPPVPPNLNNGDPSFDYRIVLAGADSNTTELFGPAVELAFWYDDPLVVGGPDFDQLRLRAETSSTETVAIDSVPYVDPLRRQGTIKIEVEPDTGAVVARFFAGSDTPSLEVNGNVGPIDQPYFLAIQASGDASSSLRARTVNKISVVGMEGE